MRNIMKSTTRHMVLSLTAVAAIAACGGPDREQSAADTAAALMAAPAASPATPAVSDPQIAAIVVAANNADIEAGRLAASKSENPKVKEFAQRMITDHGGVNKAATELVTKLGVTPEESPASEQQKQAGEQNRETLTGKSGAEFDRAYIANEVTYHQGLLDAIDTTLLPSVQNAELKALLEQTRPAVEAHLTHAQELQSSLARS
jgi:putative membrane protein